ncbi:MAG: glucokinase [Syntrophaceae bacterium]
MKNVIAVDIGGTNSRFGHFRINDNGELSYVDGLRLKTGSASSLDDLIEKAHKAGPITADIQWDAVVLAVPGAVKDNTYAKLANVPWAVDVSGLRARAAGTRIFLINDFVAQAFACPLGARLQTQIVQSGEPQAGANVAVIGAGTGLGHCALAPAGRGAFLPLPSEAGHAAFAFYGKTETAYRDYLLERTRAEYPYGDIVVSGPGLTHLHAFLTGRTLEPADIIGEITPESETTVLFARFYARAARNYALTVLALGGLFIAGGVAMKNPFLVANDHFRKEFTDSSHYGTMLEKIPVTLILSEDSGLWGAANYGAISLRTE